MDKCPACNGKIRFLREGNINNSVSDILECDCSIFECMNNLNIMNCDLIFGNDRIFKKGTINAKNFLNKTLNI